MIGEEIRRELDQHKIPVDATLDTDRTKGTWSIHMVQVFLPEQCERGEVPKAGLLLDATGNFASEEAARAEIEAKVVALVGNRPGWEVVYRWDVDYLDE